MLPTPAVRKMDDNIEEIVDVEDIIDVTANFNVLAPLSTMLSRKTFQSLFRYSDIQNAIQHFAGKQLQLATNVFICAIFTLSKHAKKEEE